MSRFLKRAEKGAAKEKAVKKRRHQSESEDSDDLQEELDAEALLVMNSDGTLHCFLLIQFCASDRRSSSIFLFLSFYIIKNNS
jgi:hypothetical protein